jgi:hypothetical protein
MCGAPQPKWDIPGGISQVGLPCTHGISQHKWDIPGGTSQYRWGIPGGTSRTSGTSQEGHPCMCGISHHKWDIPGGTSLHVWDVPPQIGHPRGDIPACVGCPTTNGTSQERCLSMCGISCHKWEIPGVGMASHHVYTLLAQLCSVTSAQPNTAVG